MEENRRVDPGDPQVPENVRARKSWFSSERKIVIEWWLLDANGEVIDAFWQKS